MKKAVFVVTECNPFHKGHRALFDEIRRAYPDDGIVCVQSGNFVQRGEFAVADKYARGEETVRGGADLVLELIPPYSALSGEAFAAAAVHVALGTGFCGLLVFGSEITDKEELGRITRRLLDPAFEGSLAERLSRRHDTGYPAVRTALYEERFGPCPALSLSNASLGISYQMALLREGATVNAVPFPHATGPAFASAVEIRSLLRSGKRNEAEKYMLDGAVSRLFSHYDPVSDMPLSETLLYLLRTLPREEIASFYGMAPLTDRAMAAARDCVFSSELFTRLKAAHLTDSRIRRSLLALLLRTPKGIEKTLPTHTLVLAANEHGRALLAQNRASAQGLKIITKPADALSDPDLRPAAERAALADSLYAAAINAPGNAFLKSSPGML